MAVRSVRAALTRLGIDHRRELTQAQADELTAVRNHVNGAHGALALLAFQLQQATTPPDPDPAAWAAAMVVPPTPEELEAAEAAADQAYDKWKNP